MNDSEKISSPNILSFAKEWSFINKCANYSSKYLAFFFVMVKSDFFIPVMINVSIYLDLHHIMIIQELLFYLGYKEMGSYFSSTELLS